MQPGPARAAVREFGYEAILAVATLTLWPILDERAVGTSEQRARALVFTPIIGFAMGVALGLADRALAPVAGTGLRSLIVVSLSTIAMLGLPWRGIADTVEALLVGDRPASTGLARIGPVGAAAAIAAFTLEVLLLARIHDPASRVGALVMASMLGRWSIVPVGYGLNAGERWGLGVPYEGGIASREFAISSVIALGLTMTLYAGLGLTVIVILALLVLGLRLLFSRRLGGAPGCALAGASALIEIAVIATLAAVAVS
ncbi:MAG TPA: adenosylcobinamide-GDP ribazoletransferase [Candidatus Binataceae bacterium]|nr:adenosylcobinamide-GDP ribazoletransferase [Candidatus Binataceae bacterium]